MPLYYIMQDTHYEAEMEKVGDGLLVLTFSASWSEPYQQFDPKLMQYSEDYKDVRFVCCDFDDGKELIHELDVNAVPTFWFIKKKQVLYKLEGVDEDKFKELLLKYK